MTAPTLPAPVDVAVPDSHLDLLARPVVGVLTTMLPDGQPQSSLVWVDYDGTCARVNTTLERRKGRDLGDRHQEASFSEAGDDLAGLPDTPAAEPDFRRLMINEIFHVRYPFILSS